MNLSDFIGFFQAILINMASFWNMLGNFVIAGLPWTRWLLLFLGASVILGIVKHSISDAGGVSVSSSVSAARSGKGDK